MTTDFTDFTDLLIFDGINQRSTDNDQPQIQSSKE
jgi:hypothetical protein